MVISIPEIVAAVCPDRYFNPDKGNDFENSEKIKEYKKLINEIVDKSNTQAMEEEKKSGIKETEKQKEERIVRAYLEAINKAQEKGMTGFRDGIILGTSSDAEHKLIYDSPSETLEPIYFFILDLINDFGFYTEKFVDNFVSSPGSAHFGEMGQRLSILQQQGQKLMGDINNVIRSVINLVYDLREFKIRLQNYEDLNSKDSEISKAAKLTLKQIWLDKVDFNSRGNSSIKAMALGGGGFSTLLNAFLVIENEKDAEKMDLNDVVKRILISRINEFNNWIIYSESELKKRFEIEKNYLKSQMNSLKIYISWAKPYLRSAKDLEMGERNRHPALVKMFNTLLLQLTLCAKRNFKDTWDDRLGELEMYPDSIPYSKSHKFLEIIFVDFEFRGIPQRTQQGFVSGGRAEIIFRGYGMTTDEFDLVKRIFDKSEAENAFELIEGATTDSIQQLTKDIDYFLYDKKEENKIEEKKENIISGDNSNPFLALLGIYNKKDKKTKLKKQGKSQDERLEKDYIIPALRATVKEDTFKFFEIYKKAHGMAAFP